jgi:hypothetical protein
VGKGLRGRDDGGNVCNISLIGIFTVNSPLYNDNILIKIYNKKYSNHNKA